MSKPAPVFRSIAAPLDADDSALDALNERLGVPTMIKPTQATQPAAPHLPHKIEASPPNAPQKVSVERLANNSSQRQAVAATRAQTVKLTIEVPDYLVDAIKHKAIEKRTTARLLVMQSLKASGYAIQPVDLEPVPRGGDRSEP